MEKEIKDKKVIESTLNELLIKCNDAKEGFIKASGLVDDEELKALLLKKSKQRIRFACDIENEMLAIGLDINSSTSILSSFHRVWMELQHTFGTDARAIISECLRGEYASLEDYSSATIVEGLPASTRALIIRQREGIKKTVRKLRRCYATVQEEISV
jgi:uncharacterized protein (TIGR02284 family)